MPKHAVLITPPRVRLRLSEEHELRIHLDVTRHAKQESVDERRNAVAMKVTVRQCFDFPLDHEIRNRRKGIQFSISSKAFVLTTFMMAAIVVRGNTHTDIEVIASGACERND